MDKLPDSVKDLLQSDLSSTPCCSECGDWLQHASEDTVLCPTCQRARYCSCECQSKHKTNHEGLCSGLEACIIRATNPTARHFESSGIVVLPNPFADTVQIGDQLVRMGFHCDSIPNRNFYFREALRTYVMSMTERDGYPNSGPYGSRAEDRVLFLLILLGGDAQLLLDWLSFTASNDNVNSSDESFDQPSSESQQNIKLPLLALHGLFEKDLKNDATTMANLYLLASCRSLAEHRSSKVSYEVYQSIVRNGIDNHLLDPKLGAMNRYISSFLWAPNGYEYGEALSDEIPRILQHIRKHKKGGVDFLQSACDAKTNFSPHDNPYLLTNRREEPPPDIAAAFVFQASTVSVAEIPEFWLLYQKCFLSMKPHLDLLNEFLEGGDYKQPAKSKKD